MIHDIQTEQHRIKLLSAVLQMLLQIKLSRKAINSTAQEKLDELLEYYEIKDGKSCNIKVSSAQYDSSMHYIE